MRVMGSGHSEGARHHARFVGQAGLEFLTSGDPPTLAFQSAGITGMSHPPRLTHFWIFLKIECYGLTVPIVLLLGSQKIARGGDDKDVNGDDGDDDLTSVPGEVAHACNPSTLGGRDPTFCPTVGLALALLYISLGETGFCHVGQAGLKLMSSDLPSLASQSAGIPGMSHRTQLTHIIVQHSYKSLAKVSLSRPGWSAVTRSRLTETSASLVQAILLPQPPEWSLTLLPRLECSGVISTHGNFHFLGSRDSATSASRVAGTTGERHHTRLTFVFLVEIGFHHVGQASFELLTSSDPSALASQSAGIIGVSHCALPDTDNLDRAPIWGSVAHYLHCAYLFLALGVPGCLM
ncbi:hypothetical protein AAY473_028153 [Plecturocebus cupreus]